jgi:hypothetical protein
VLLNCKVKNTNNGNKEGMNCQFAGEGQKGSDQPTMEWNEERKGLKEASV